MHIWCDVLGEGSELGYLARTAGIFGPDVQGLKQKVTLFEDFAVSCCSHPSLNS